MNAGNVEIGNNIAIDGDVLSYLETFRVGQSLAVEFPGDLGSRVSAGSTLEVDTWSRLQCLFVESGSYLRWLD